MSEGFNLALFNWMDHNKHEWIAPFVWFDMVQTGSVSGWYPMAESVVAVCDMLLKFQNLPAKLACKFNK